MDAFRSLSSSSSLALFALADADGGGALVELFLLNRMKNTLC